MSEAGIYALTKALLGGVSALMTGPLGTMDLPEGSLEAALTASGPGMVIELVSEAGPTMGRMDDSGGGSPGTDLLHPAFVPGLIATEDARFHEHPGVDPFAVLSALADGGGGRVRGGSSLTQQAVKNEVLDSSRTLERKLLEAVLSVRAVHGLGRERLLDGYLAKSWFGRGTFGTVGAPHAWFDKTWDEVTLAETALLIGLLKGPARYDPDRNPELARARRDAVLGRMLAEGVISREAFEAAKAEPVTARAGSAGAPTDPWVEAAVLRELEIAPLPPSDRARATLTIDPAWQALTQEAVSWGANRVGGLGPAGRIAPELIASGDLDRVRDAMAPMVDPSPSVGRALVTGTAPLRVLVDRGYGPLEPDTPAAGPEGARVGEVYPYRRVDGRVELVPTPQVNAAAVVMEARTGAILAVVGGANPDASRFDRSRAQRQVGSAIKPFLWARALEAGYRFDEMVPDVAASYVTATGEVWSPQNYDRTETGLIPLFVALEESSNNVAARLVDQLGVGALAEITEAAGVYPQGGMRRHPSSALGASESSLVALASGYASIANGGVRVTPHVHVLIESDGALLIPETPREVPVMTRDTASRVSSMLYGVTTRGTAAGVFGPSPPVAGKTGTTQDHRDAWFVGFSGDLVVAVWVGRDDNAPLPGRATGASAAAPIAARIIASAERDGLARGFSRSDEAAWPPALLTAGPSAARTAQTGALIFEPDPEARRRAMEAGSDPFKNPQDLFERIREGAEPRGREEQVDVWTDQGGQDPWSPPASGDAYDPFAAN
jgi:penicillin-binding protein 1A